MNPSTFFARAVPLNPDAWKQDLDVACPKQVIHSLSAQCGFVTLDLNRHTIRSYRQYVDPYDGISTALPRWISPAYIRRKTPHHHGLKYCPVCLSESPHHPLSRRWAFMFGCQKHNVLLHDRCARCHSPVSSRKVFSGLIKECPEDMLAYCYHCGDDYRYAKKVSLNDRQQAALNAFSNVLETGWYNIDINSSIYSHLYFQALRLVVRGLFRVAHSKQVIDCFSVKELDLIFSEGRNEHEEVEFFPIHLSNVLLVTAYELLCEWPDRFIAFNVRNELNYSAWIMPRDVVPYWFSVVAKSYLRKANLSFR